MVFHGRQLEPFSNHQAALLHRVHKGDSRELWCKEGENGFLPFFTVCAFHHVMVNNVGAVYIPGNPIICDWLRLDSSLDKKTVFS